MENPTPPNRAFIRGMQYFLVGMFVLLGICAYQFRQGVQPQDMPLLWLSLALTGLMLCFSLLFRDQLFTALDAELNDTSGRRWSLWRAYLRLSTGGRRGFRVIVPAGVVMLVGVHVAAAVVFVRYGWPALTVAHREGYTQTDLMVYSIRNSDPLSFTLAGRKLIPDFDALPAGLSQQVLAAERPRYPSDADFAAISELAGWGGGGPDHGTRVTSELAKLFPAKTDREAVRGWGRALAATLTWVRRIPPDERTNGILRIVRETHTQPVSDADADHAAWVRLRLTRAVPFETLEQLPDRVRAAVGNETTVEQLREWARARRATTTVPTPDLPWFDDWVVWEDWRPLAEHWAEFEGAVRTELGGARLGRDPWIAFQAFGEEVLADEASLGRTVPAPRGPRVAVLAATDRLTGNDLRSRRIAGDVSAQPRLASAGLCLAAMHLYPNDDVAAIQFSRFSRFVDRLRFSSPLCRGLFVVAVWLFMLTPALMLQRILRQGAVDVFGALLRVRNDPSFVRYRSRVFDPYHQSVVIPLVLLGGWVANRFTVEPVVVVFVESELAFATAVVWAAMMSAVLTETFENLLSVTLLRCGVDPARIIWDNVIVAVLAVVVLRYYQNGWASIFAGVALGLSGSVLHKIRSRSTRIPDRDI